MPSLQKILDFWDVAQLPVSKMAQLTEISESTLRRLKKDPETGASFETAARIAKALNVSLDELVGIEIKKEVPAPEPVNKEPLPCHRECPLQQAHDKYAELADKHTELYKQTIAVKNRCIAILAAACGVLVLSIIGVALRF